MSSSVSGLLRGQGVRTEKDPGNHVTTYGHNAAGWLKFEIDATDVRTECEYDGVGNLRLIKLPLGRTTETATTFLAVNDDSPRLDRRGLAGSPCRRHRSSGRARGACLSAR